MCNWINLFNPQNINVEALKLPVELTELEEHAKNLVNDFPKLD